MCGAYFVSRKSASHKLRWIVVRLVLERSSNQSLFDACSIGGSSKPQPKSSLKVHLTPSSSEILSLVFARAVLNKLLKPMFI